MQKVTQNVTLRKYRILHSYGSHRVGVRCFVPAHACAPAPLGPTFPGLCDEGRASTKPSVEPTAIKTTWCATAARAACAWVARNGPVVPGKRAQKGVTRPRTEAPSALCGPFDDVEIPRGGLKTDWEVELGVVIGSKTKYVTPERALEHVAGYCVINDLSERAFQLEGTGQWVKGKSCDTFGPMGPYLVTRDEVPDPQNLHLWLEVDGRRFQDGNTKTMVFTVAFLVSYLSRFMSLHPGEVISTGTPPGVGLGQKPEPIYLRAGQIMRLGIDGLGEQRQRTVAG